MPTAYDRRIGCANCGKSIICDSPFGMCWECQIKADRVLLETLHAAMCKKASEKPPQHDLPTNHI